MNPRLLSDLNSTLAAQPGRFRNWSAMARRLLIAWAMLMPLALSAAEPSSEDSSSRVDFNRDIRPILSNNCLQCHGPDEQERQGGVGGLRLDVVEEATMDLGGYAAVVPGDPEASELIRRITTEDEGEQMPPADFAKRLDQHDIEILKTWIAEGADFARHWAYTPPQRPRLPTVHRADWPRNEIDLFILRRLEAEGLEPSPEADRPTLIRRLSLDLTGLPPTPDEVDRFLNDSSPDAYEQLVNRLLKKKSYGEHWARQWLDLARYADSAGYADDPPRTIWAYRDYVIQSLNDNKPFDQFTREQLAGDLFPEPTDEQLIATAFHRNTLTNNEGGTNDEEFRNEAVVDRVNTTMAVWMGTTMACAQCHTHKYDPITQEEYFRFFAIFNHSADADRKDEAPVLELYTDEQKERREKLRGEAEQLKQRLTTLTPELAEEDVGQVAPELQEARERLATIQQQLAELKPRTTVPVMRELPEDQRRKTFIQYRGNYLDVGPEVEPGLPTAFHAAPSDRPVDRLTLADWLMADENPLVGRVVANRYWETIFGIGIVTSSEEFGSQGELPTHPELLDWLATELPRRNWDLKSFLTLLVTSSTYRQASHVTPELYQRDPENRLLARGPRFRLSAESIRDQALFVSGLLSEKMHGEPARPPQPSLGLTAAFGSGIDWKTSDGEDRYRRGLYTTWRRSNPYPSMVTFDAPNREVCTVQRGRTNTPLQALVTLNDPVYVEAAQTLARRIMAAGESFDQQIDFGVRLCLARPPSEMERTRLLQLWEAALDRYGDDPALAREMAGIGPEESTDDGQVIQHAAWTVVGNVLLNLDEMFMKR
jgi:mono/diheme cytochrome c family protein